MSIEKQVKSLVLTGCRIVKILYFLALLTSTEWAIEVDGVSELTHGIMLERCP